MLIESRFQGVGGQRVWNILMALLCRLNDFGILVPGIFQCVTE